MLVKQNHEATLSNDQLAFIASDPKLYKEQRAELEALVKENKELCERVESKKKLDELTSTMERRSAEAAQAKSEAMVALKNAEDEAKSVLKNAQKVAEEEITKAHNIRNSALGELKEAEKSRAEAAEAHAVAESRKAQVAEELAYLEGRKGKIRALIEMAQGLV